jgi:hypothetical protein
MSHGTGALFRPSTGVTIGKLASRRWVQGHGTRCVCDGFQVNEMELGPDLAANQTKFAR